VSNSCRFGPSKGAARRALVPAAKHAELCSAADTVASANHTQVGVRGHPLGCRSTRQNGGRRHPGRSAERHVGCARGRPNHSLAGLGSKMTFIPRRGRAHLHPIRLGAIPGPALRQERVDGAASGLGGPARAAANSRSRYAATGPLVDVTTLAPSRHARADAIRRW
jgi:hypothetical protein